LRGETSISSKKNKNGRNIERGRGGVGFKAMKEGGGFSRGPSERRHEVR